MILGAEFFQVVVTGRQVFNGVCLAFFHGLHRYKCVRGDGAAFTVTHGFFGVKAKVDVIGRNILIMDGDAVTFLFNLVDFLFPR